MQGLAKLLVIEDDANARVNLSNILEFVGEQVRPLALSNLTISTGREFGQAAFWGLSTTNLSTKLVTSYLRLTIYHY